MGCWAFWSPLGKFECAVVEISAMSRWKPPPLGSPELLPCIVVSDRMAFRQFSQFSWVAPPQILLQISHLGTRFGRWLGY